MKEKTRDCNAELAWMLGLPKASTAAIRKTF